MHVGLGTVNLRGEGFVTHYTDGQRVKAGDLLLTFDQQLIQERGYNDVVITFLTQPGHVQQMTAFDKAIVMHGDLVTEITFEI